MSNTRIVTLVALIAVLCSQPAIADETAKISAREFVAMLVGEFDSAKQQAADQQQGLGPGQAHGRVNRTFQLVDAPSVGEFVIVTTTSYKMQTWYFDRNEFMVWTVTAVDDGVSLKMSPRRFKNYDRRVPFANAPGKLSGFSTDDLEPAIGGAACDIVWKSTAGGYSGQSEPCRVMSVTKNKLLTWEWQFTLTDHALMVAFSGTDDTGAVLDGSPAGQPYRLDRKRSN